MAQHSCTQPIDDIQTAISKLTDTQQEMMVVMKQLVAQDKRILNGELATKRIADSLEKAFARIRILESAPGGRRSLRRDAMLVLASWSGSALFTVVVYLVTK